MEAAATPTRDRILFAAAELFRRQGYAGTGLKQVVGEAHATFGSLYHHFPGGKQQLADEVVRTGGAFFAALVTAVYDAEDSPEASVRAVFTGAADTLAATDFQDACPIATIALEVASTDEALRQATAEVFTAWTDGLAERLGDRTAALAVLAALEGAFVLCRAQRSVEPMLAAGNVMCTYVAHATASVRAKSSPLNSSGSPVARASA
ncbi:MAG: helix-turn-helix domain-containing protein [Solirubrobacteraceae bacterium]